MAEHPLPEMTRLSLSDLGLRIKIMNVKLGSSIEDVLTRALGRSNRLMHGKLLTTGRSAVARQYSACGVSTSGSSSPHSDRGHHAHGSTTEQTTDGCAYRKILAFGGIIPMPGPSLNNCCDIELEVAISLSIRTGAGSRQSKSGL